MGSPSQRQASCMVSLLVRGRGILLSGRLRRSAQARADRGAGAAFGAVESDDVHRGDLVGQVLERSKDGQDAGRGEGRGPLPLSERANSPAGTSLGPVAPGYRASKPE